MKIFEQLAQEIQGRVTIFLMKYFKNKQKPEYWMHEVARINEFIDESENVLELKVALQDYLKEVVGRFWIAVPGSKTRDLYKSLREVLDDPEYSDKSLLLALAEEEKAAVDKKVRKIRRELRATVKTVKKECRQLRKDLSEQTAEVKRLSIENQLLIAALLKLNDQYTKFVDENNADKLTEEVATLKVKQKDLLAQNQKLIKIIGVLIKRSTKEVKQVVKNSDDSPGLIVLKLKQLSAKNKAGKARGFFSEQGCREEFNSSFEDSFNQSSAECY